MTSPSGIRQLASQREAFLGFVRARLGDQALAEEVLQSAYLRAVDGLGALRDEASAVAWFYQVLRNAILDVQRRRGRVPEALPLEDAGEEVLGVSPAQLEAVACRCVTEVVEGLTPAHARLVRRVDLEGASVPTAAAEEGITANNAGVRLHRARAALKEKLKRACGACARHGCLDCDCHRRPA